MIGRRSLITGAAALAAYGVLGSDAGAVPQRPGRIYGVNFGHPCARNVRLAAVADGFSMVDYLLHERATVHGGMSGDSAKYMGNSVIFNGTDSYLTFEKRTQPASEQFITMATIVRVDGVPSSLGGWIGTARAASAPNGWTFRWGSSQPVIHTATPVPELLYQYSPFGTNLSTGVPYFLAASVSVYTGGNTQGTVNFVTRDLTTGRTSWFTAPQSNWSFGASAYTVPGGNGTYVVGAGNISANDPNRFWSGAMSLAFVADAYLPVEALIQWSQDPWSIFSQHLAAE